MDQFTRIELNTKSCSYESIFEHFNLTTNYHHYGVLPKDFKHNKHLSKHFEIVANSYDENGREYIAVIEGKTLPFFGYQFHPEKPGSSFHSKGVEHTESHI